VPSVYVETTIPSYLVARRSRDLIVSAHQQLTHDWWETARHRFDLFVSEAVLDEMRSGDSRTAAKRIALVADLQVLKYSADVEELASEYERRLGLTGAATSDLPHLAYSVVYNMDYLLTWNCRHIANGLIIRQLLKVNHLLGRPTPVILTPTELMADLADEEE